MKNKINETFNIISEKIDKSRILLVLKFLIFFTLMFTAVVMYNIRNIYLANDIIIMAAIFVILNKIDNIR